jgi:hypothetical protein
MWEWMNETLFDFRMCFTRKAAFDWFIVIILGFIIGREHVGVTSVIRELYLESSHYESILHFFRATSWEIEPIRRKWISLVKKHSPLIEMEGYYILAGDGVKQPKEARRMPGVKKLHQESENVSKAEYIFGHLFGAVGVLAGNIEKMFCIPLSATIQDGVKVIREWAKSGSAKLSHVEQVVEIAGECTRELGKSIIVLDRLFLSVNALIACMKHINKTGEWMLHIVTKAKSTAVAYEEPTVTKGKGRPRKKGKAITLWTLFDSKIAEFVQLQVKIYNEIQTVSYMTIDLLWGKKLYQKLRFVLVILEDGSKSILVSTKLDLTAVQIIQLYSWRFKIEVQFKELKHTLGGFAYRFWSKQMPKLKRFAPAKTNLLEGICDPHVKGLIISVLKAIEGYMMFACIALGMLQIIALKFGTKIQTTSFLWLRTKTNDIPTESTIIRYLSKNIFRIIEKYKDFGIYQIIRRKQECGALEDYPMSS